MISFQLVSFYSFAQQKTKKISKSAIESQFVTGMQSYLKEDYQEAVLIWESLLAEKVDDPGLYYYLAKANASLGSEANAILYAEKAHLLRPASLDYGLFYVDMLLKKRKYNESVEVLHKISAYDESQPDVNIRLAQANLMLENGDEAIKALNKSDHYIGDFPVIIRTKQFIYLKQKKWKEFQEVSLHFLENFPEENLMEWELLEMLPIEEAALYEPLLDSILIVYPNLQQVNFIKAINRLKENKLKESADLLELTLSDERVEPDILAVFFEDFNKALQKNKDTFHLEDVIEKALNVYGNSNELAYVLGETYINQSNVQKASWAFNLAISNGNRRFEAYAQLVQLDMYQNQIDSALVHVDKAMKLFPSNGFFYYQKGFVLSYQGKSKEAIETLNMGLPFIDKRFDYYVRTQSLLGDLYHKTGSFLESDEAFEKVLQIDPKDDHVLNNYSYFLSLRKENLEKALKMSATLIELIPDNSTYLDTHGWVWFQMGKYDKALSFLQQAFDKSMEPSAEIIEHLGDVKYKLGMKKEAIRLWKMAFEKNNLNKLLEKKIQRKEYFEN